MEQRRDTLPDKKITILVGGLPPVYNGGTEIATVNIAKYAAKAGHEVHAIALDGTKRGKTLYKTVEDGFIVHRIRTIQIPYLYGLVGLPEAVQVVLRLKPDIIHAQGAIVAPAAFLASKIGHIPYIYYGRGEVYTKWPLKRILLRLFLNHASRVIAQTRDMKREFQSLVNRKVEVIPNGVNCDNFVSITKSEARTRLRWQTDLNLILFVGRARPEKNIGCFVQVMDWLRSRGDCYAMVLGDGPEIKKAKWMARCFGLSNIDFRGDVDNSYVPLYMRAADVLVNTSFSEGFPVSVLEAMACALPVVVPRICGLPEIIEDGMNGIITEPNNPEAMSFAVNRILNDYELAKRMSLNNLKKARQYSWENVVKKLYG